MEKSESKKTRVTSRHSLSKTPHLPIPQIKTTG
jgi:hypothetical protein